MADHVDQLGEAVDRLAARDRSLAGVAHRRDAVLDATAVAASAVGGTVVAPDPAIESGLDPVDGVLAASGLMGWRVWLVGRWWRALTAPVVARTADGPAALVPGRRGWRWVDGVSRRSRPADSSTAHDANGPAVALAHPLPDDDRWWRLVVWSLGRRRGDLWLLLVLGVLGGIAGLLLPLTTQAIFESAVPEGATKRVVVALLAFAIGSAGAAVLVLGRGLLVVRIRDRSDSVLAPSVVAQMLRLPATFFRAHSTGDLSNRALAVDAARQQIDDSVVAAVITAAFGLVNIVYLLSASTAVGALCLLAVLVALLAALTAQIRIRRRLPALLDTRSRSDATLLGLMQSLVAWRVAGAEDRALARWAIDQGASTSALRDRLRAIGVGEPINVAAPLLIVVVFVVSVILVPGAELRPGSTSAPGVFLAMYAAVAQLAIAVLALGNQVTVLSELGPLMSRLHPITAEPRERPHGAQRPGPLSGAVAFSQVVFGYRADQAPLLDGLDLAIEPGEFVAVVGPSGGGKSTLLRLLLGFETPWSGTVTYDGRDLAGLDAASVRRQLGVVLQASRPLGVTIRDCVTGPRAMDDAEVWELLREAGLADDVARMPARLDSPVGDHGTQLSGGQRQRLMIAAALAAKPRILLLDEATSALDNVTQAVVMRTVLGYPSTRIVVAHRLSTVREADRVIVVSNGGISEQGAPEELIAADGHFARLAARQEV